MSPRQKCIDTIKIIQHAKSDLKGGDVPCVTFTDFVLIVIFLKLNGHDRPAVLGLASSIAT